jgi:V/A-type H+-transporting ATPase subunit I
MMKPRKMKRIELTVLRRDADRVLEYLGMQGVLHLAAGEVPPPEPAQSGADSSQAILDRLGEAAAYLRFSLSDEPGRGSRLPTAEDALAVRAALEAVAVLREREAALSSERKKIEDALSEAKSFSNLNAPFSDLERLSYLTLRVGRIDPRRVGELRESLGDRAAVIPLGDDGRVLAAASRKGRFALDTELGKVSFAPIVVPEGFTGVPRELMAGLEKRAAETDRALAELGTEKAEFAARSSPQIARLADAYRIAAAVDRLKAGLETTRSAYRLRGWIAADRVEATVADLERLADGRVAVRSYDPEEVETVREGTEKVPVSLDHGRFVGGFERVVFSYGAPLYGTIDPTPFVAFSFTILFGLMFGDVGQGLVLLLLGLLADRGRLKPLSRFSRFSPALMAVGISSMVVGFLDGEVFANESILIRPMRAVSGFLTGVPVDRVLHLMPEKGNLERLFLFFGFTVAVGVVLNSVGLVINIVNLISLRRWEKALFSKTGASGALVFWYALFFALRVASGGSPAWFDAVGLGLPALGLFFGPALWRLAAKERPVLEHGAMAFIMEGFVEILESASYYVSNTVSFLRVGAFALSHAVLSFIVFTLSTMVSRAPAGAALSLLVVVAGNAIIILLEGLIVAIQVVRLEYYEFFSKFFTETGVEFSPFRFRREVQQ